MLGCSSWPAKAFATIGQVLKPLIDKEAVLYTDGAPVYSAFTKKTGIAHEVIHTKGPLARGVFHVQNVNAYGSRLKTWMRRFHGVATKYLVNYLGWRMLLERYKSAITPTLCLLEAIGRIPQQLSRSLKKAGKDTSSPPKSMQQPVVEPLNQVYGVCFYLSEEY